MIFPFEWQKDLHIFGQLLKNQGNPILIPERVLLQKSVENVTNDATLETL